MLCFYDDGLQTIIMELVVVLVGSWYPTVQRQFISIHRFIGRGGGSSTTMGGVPVQSINFFINKYLKYRQVVFVT